MSFGNFARGHFLGNVGLAHLRFLMACYRSEIEPLMRLDKIALNAVAASRKCNAEIVVSDDVTIRRSSQAVGYQ